MLRSAQPEEESLVGGTAPDWTVVAGGGGIAPGMLYYAGIRLLLSLLPDH